MALQSLGDISRRSEHPFQPGDTLKECLGVVAGRVGTALRREYDVYVLDVVGDGEGLCRACTLAVDTDLERTEAIELHTLGVLQLVAHGLNHLLDDGADVADLHGTVALHDGCQLLGIDGTNL